MRGGGHESGSPHEDLLLSRLFQQVTEAEAARFGDGYDLAAGLERYRAWLREHAEEAAPDDEPGLVTLPGGRDAAGPDRYFEDSSALLATVTGTLPEGFGVPPTAHAEWNADLAVTELYAQHYRSLVRLAAMLVRDTPTAEEVVQDAFVAMHGGWQRLRDTEKALAYLRQAVVNRSRSVLRHRLVVDKNLQSAPPDMPSAEYGAFVQLERSAVVAALRDLPERQREAIVLRYYADLSEAEIANAMKITRGAVKSHTARGMTALRAALEQRL